MIFLPLRMRINRSLSYFERIRWSFGTATFISIRFVIWNSYSFPFLMWQFSIRTCRVRAKQYNCAKQVESTDQREQRVPPNIPSPYMRVARTFQPLNDHYRCDTRRAGAWRSFGKVGSLEWESETLVTAFTAYSRCQQPMRCRMHTLFHRTEFACASVVLRLCGSLISTSGEEEVSPAQNTRRWPFFKNM